MTTEGDARHAVRFVAAGNRIRLAQVGATAFVGGAAEALFLVTVTRAGFAITNSRDEVGIIAGRFLSVQQTLLLAVGLIVVRAALGATTSWTSAHITARVVAELRSRVSAAFLNATWSAQQAQQSGSLQEILSVHTAQASTVMTSTTSGIVAGANLVALLALAGAVDPAGAVVLVGFVVLVGMLLRPLRHAVRRRADTVVQAGLDFATSIHEISRLGMEFHVFHVQDRAEQKVSAFVDEHRRRWERLFFVSSLSSTLFVALAYLALVGGLAVVATSSSANLTSLGAVMLIMLRSLSYGQALQTSYVSIASAAPAIRRLRSALDDLTSNRRHDGGVAVGRVDEVEFADVSFSYDPDTPVIRDVSFTLRSNEIVGVIGPSGGGKSTLVQLLLALRDPTGGTIRADGRDVSEFDRSEWARRVTFVGQTPRLISGSIADNIRFFRQDIPTDSVRRAAEMANVHDEIAKMSGGYDHFAGDAGAELSGGQQQRICIARALIERPDILVLDEPTSSLDVRSEEMIRGTLEELRSEMTVVIIAHRLSTLGMCDRIMVIQDGELRGFDTPDNLARSDDFYRESLALSGLR